MATEWYLGRRASRVLQRTCLRSDHGLAVPVVEHLRVRVRIQFKVVLVHQMLHFLAEAHLQSESLIMVRQRSRHF